MKHQQTKQDGFTLIEISLAMAIFTFMLLVVSLAYINIARLYNASTAARNVQQNNRFAMEQISRVARVAKTATVTTTPYQGICFKSQASEAYFYLRNIGNGDALKNELLQAKSCGTPGANPQVLTAPGSYAARLTADTSVESSVTIRLWMTSRTDLLNTVDLANLSCKGGAGSEFCAINNLTTTVGMRGE